MKQMVREKKFYTQFFSMMAVLVLQNVITISVNLADNMMLGAYSEMSLSGVAAVNQVQFIYQQILYAAGAGIVILGSQYFGRGEREPVKRVSAAAMRFALCLCLVLFIAATAVPGLILSAFTDNGEVIAEGVRYMRVIRFTYPFFAVTQILLGTLRSAGEVRIAFILSLIALGVNCCMNYTLIFGHFGAPRLGVTGAAIGTLTARIVELIVLIVYLLKKEKLLQIRPADYVRTDRRLTADFFRVTWPMLVVQGLWGFNTALQNAILGHMTVRAIAANSVASTLFLLVKTMPIGSCDAASFLIGRTIGEGNEEKLKSYARTLQVLFLCVGIVGGVVLFFIRIPILKMYSLEPETLEMANHFLLILSVITVTMSYQMPTNNGIIRGGGDTSFTMKLDLISIWGIVLPLSFIMAFVVKASPEIVVCCLNSDQVFKAVPAFIKANYGHWAKKLTQS